MTKSMKADTPLALTTPLEGDQPLLEEIAGNEAISELFQFRLTMLAETPIPFDKLLGKAVAVNLSLPNGTTRWIHGIVSRLGQGDRVASATGLHPFTRYWVDVVPDLWRLTRRVQSRIFQDMSVPEILTQILEKEWSLSTKVKLSSEGFGYPKRNYCVQYRESDFAFISRLMEEEGIYYYFEHSETGHCMVINDPLQTVPEVSEAKEIHYVDQHHGPQTAARIYNWSKFQSICSDKHTLCDYHFERPSSHLFGQFDVLESLQVGTAVHYLRYTPHPGMLVVDDYPGGFAHHADGVSRGGGDQEKDLERLDDEANRAARLRAEAEVVEALSIEGAGDAAHFVAGFWFSLCDHVDADARYRLTRVEHSARQDFAAGGTSDPNPVVYKNRFACLPLELPYRPARRTPKPKIAGTQTAVVVGAKDSHIYTDKYGRVKVQFRWERQGKNNEDSSCWVRVGQFWAGKKYGAFFWPRPGHEVIVAFEEGDPDRPIIVGSVYNEANEPPFELPKENGVTGILSCSLGGDPGQESNSLLFHDIRGDEHVQLHSQKQLVHSSEVGTLNVTPGPAMVICGAMPVPSGSGSGGGLWDWPTAVVTPLGVSPWDAFLPGKTNVVGGERVDITLLGNAYNHVIFGSNIDFVVDLEQLLTDTGLGHIPVVKWLPLPGLIGGASGNVSFVIGQTVDTTYGGERFSVTRGETIDFHGPALRFSLQPYDILARVFAALTAAVGTAGDLAARLVAHVEREKEGLKAGQEAGEGADLLEYAITLPGLITSRLHGILIDLEKSNAKRRIAKQEAKEATLLSEQALVDAKAALLLASEISAELASKRSEHAKQLSSDAQEEDGKKADKGKAAKPKHLHSNTHSYHAGAYSLHGEDRISIVTQSSGAALDAGRQVIHIAAEGNGEKGQLFMSASNLAALWAGTNEEVARLTLHGKAGALLEASKGDIQIVQGKTRLSPTITMKGSDAGGTIVLCVGGEEEGSRIELTKDSIKLSAGKECLFEVNSTGTKSQGLLNRQITWLSRRLSTLMNAIDATKTNQAGMNESH